MALASTCVAPCSVLPSLGVEVAGRSHRSRPGHSSAVAEARSGRPRGRAPTGSGHSSPRDAGGSQFTPSRPERRPGFQRLCRALQEQRQRLQGRPRPAPTPSASKMLQVFPERKPNPLRDANLCSRLVFWWINPLFKIGYKRRLEEDDMYSVLPGDRSQYLGQELQRYWDQEVLRANEDTREPSLMKAIIKCYWKSYMPFAIFTLFELL
ncbi:uncharacterized protein LOC123464839 [Bubalus bubalis]|uniref:uncharacterized protein LOC123464839 n=1 Tax=Bubalus bubalis TaxID=89462 RepID=UPI001E1B8F61|nr:uncharacterized protein LOC123464839 [Bubalus bubalis]